MTQDPGSRPDGGGGDVHGAGAGDGAAPVVTLLTRDGCAICRRVADELAALCGEAGAHLVVTDVDRLAAAGETGPRAEFGDRLPVVMLDGAEHSYWEVDAPALRADIARARGALRRCGDVPR